MYSKTADRTVDVFEAFAKAQAPLSLSELARALKVPPSSCFNLIRALEERGYLYSLRRRGRIYPTRRLFDIAKAIAAGDPWMTRLEPALLSLRNQSRETVIFGKRQDGRVIYLNVLEGPQTIRYSARAGDLKPLHSSAIGKSILGALEPEEFGELLLTLPLERVTEATITDRDGLRADIESARRRGYFMTSGENVADVMAVAVSLRLGGEVYAIAIAGPVHRMATDLTNHVSGLKRTCTAIVGSADESGLAEKGLAPAGNED